jgi:GNAT superfamily N-acetyltransferase
MIRTHRDYELDDNVDRIEIDTVHAWLASAYWWSHGITREQVVRGTRCSSLVIGAYLDGKQVATARVVSDTIRFAWIADVFVAPEHRGRGIARAMIRFALDHPNLSDVTSWLLATRDAHGVYAALGFGEPDPGVFLQLRRLRRTTSDGAQQPLAPAPDSST